MNDASAAMAHGPGMDQAMLRALWRAGGHTARGRPTATLRTALPAALRRELEAVAGRALPPAGEQPARRPPRGPSQCRDGPASSPAAGMVLPVALACALQVLLYRYTGHEALRIAVAAPEGRTVLGPPLSAELPFLAHLCSALACGDGGSGRTQAADAALVFCADRSPDSATPPDEPDIDLQLQLRRQGARLIATWRYDPERFAAQTIERLSDSYLAVLRGIVRDPKRALGRLALISEGEHRRLLAAGDGGTLALPASDSILDLIAAQARRRPKATALAQGKTVVSFAGLEARSRQVAALLRARGVGAAARLGIAVGNGPDLPIVLLGAWRLGATCVLLDAEDPVQRLSAIVADAGITLVCGSAATAERLAGLGTAVVTLDAAAPPSPRAETAEARPARDAIAYVVYTSGTTGTPKGVTISHGQLVNFLHTIQDGYRFEEDDVMLCMARPAFGIIIFEALWPLAAGGAVRFLPPGQGFDAGRICDALEEVTAVHTVATTLQAVLDAAGERIHQGARYANIRHLFVGGERVAAALLRQIPSVFPRARGYVQYGCTEATHLSLRQPLAVTQADAGDVVGRPFKNTRVRICDAADNVLPVGVSGEILLGGPGISAGYLNRPDLTLAHFVRLGGQRYYRTGDLGRYLPDGSVAFVGRRDEQVKVRGARVELGEIDAVLRAHPALSAAAAVLQEDAAAAGGVQLVACCVRADNTATGKAVDAAELRHFLAARLPDYMIPARFVFLEALPTNANRKLDRHALAHAVHRLAAPAAPAEPPRGRLQALLAEIWREVLGAEGIGAADNFFDLGGDSLKATLVTNRLQVLLGEIVHVVALLDAPTPAALADYLQAHYPEAVARLLEVTPAPPSRAPGTRVDAAMIDALRALIPPLPGVAEPDAPRNHRAIFVLSPPRSGSTLLRVVLGGHPGLFAPPEMDLLSFNTVSERKTILSGKYYFWLEGTVRAIMELRQCTAAEAWAIMDDCEGRGLSTRAFYGLLQGWLGERILVDKTPYYGLNPQVLARAERDFEAPLYIHLARHPAAMVHSFEEGRFDLVFFSKNRVVPSFPRRQLGEMVWTLTHRNILDFLAGVPAARQMRVRYEDLVGDPRQTAQRLCDFIGVPLDAAMLDPYQDAGRRMTDGIHAASKMLGDVKFLSYQHIDGSKAERWRQAGTADTLGDLTWALAERFGYPREAG